MSAGYIDVKPLITDRFQFHDALDAYRKLDDRSSLGILLDYQGGEVKPSLAESVILKESDRQSNRDWKRILYWCWQLRGWVLIPEFKRSGANMFSIVTSGGVSAVHHGKKRVSRLPLLILQWRLIRV